MTGRDHGQWSDVFAPNLRPQTSNYTHPYCKRIAFARRSRWRHDLGVHNLLVSANEGNWESTHRLSIQGERFGKMSGDEFKAQGVTTARAESLRLLERELTLLMYEHCVTERYAESVRVGHIQDIQLEPSGWLSFRFSERVSSWKPSELECLRDDVSALGHKLERLKAAMHEALMLHASGEPHVHMLQDAMRQILGEHATGYWLRVREGKTQHFVSWAEREAAIVKLRAAGETSIEFA